MTLDSMFTWNPDQVALLESHTVGAGYIGAGHGELGHEEIQMAAPAVVFALLKTRPAHDSKAPEKEVNLIITAREALDIGMELMECAMAALSLPRAETPTDIVDRG